jgi:predicted metal-dependent phosphoesterase TrpH
MKSADLHLHTVYSDGTCTPAELIRAAKAAGLDAIAVTDHDTFDGIPDALAAARDIELIPGAEITAALGREEVHILGYFFNDGWRDPLLAKVLEHAKRLREERVSRFVARFQELGIPLTADDIKACSTCGTIGRMHVARALVRCGAVNSVEEAFERFLKCGKPGYVDRPRMSAAEAIGHIKRARGAAGLAHPGLNNVDKNIPGLKAQGLVAIEAWHSRHTPAQTERYLRLAEHLDLIPIGGSDAHDANPGLIRIPYEQLDKLR